MSLESDVDRGKFADEVLNNPVYVEAYALIEREIFAKWQASRDRDEREQLHRLLISNEKVKSVMESVMRNGKIAGEKLAQRQGLLSRLRN